MTALKAPQTLLLYLILDPARCGGHKVALRLAESALVGGVTTIQLRAKKMPKRNLLMLATELRALMDQKGYGEGRVPLVINDLVDVAMSSGADGVHVGQEDEAVEVARRMVGSSSIVGLSVRNEKEGCVDYLGIGAVFPSGTKTESKPIGVPEFHRLCRLTNQSVVAIGGINARNLEELVRERVENFKGIAVSEAICAAKEPERAARELLGVLRGAGMAG